MIKLYLYVKRFLLPLAFYSSFIHWQKKITVFDNNEEENWENILRVVFSRNGKSCAWSFLALCLFWPPTDKRISNLSFFSA